MSLITELASRIKTKIETFNIALSQIPNNLIEFAKIQQIGAGKLLGNATGSAGNISELDINDYKNYFISLPVTIADCENTTDEIIVLSIDVPSNLLNSNNIIIDIFFVYNRFQNTGANRNLIRKFKINGNNLKNGTFIPTSSSTTSFYWHNIRLFTYGLSGNNINFKITGEEGSIGVRNATYNESFSSGASTTANKTITNIDYTTNISFELTLQWDLASPNARIRFEQAMCFIQK